MQQQILVVPGGVDPLAERLLETLVAVGNVLGDAPRKRRRDPPAKRADSSTIAGDRTTRDGWRCRNERTATEPMNALWMLS